MAEQALLSRGGASRRDGGIRFGVGRRLRKRAALHALFDQLDEQLSGRSQQRPGFGGDRIFRAHVSLQRGLRFSRMLGMRASPG